MGYRHEGVFRIAPHAAPGSTIKGPIKVADKASPGGVIEAQNILPDGR